VILHDAVNFFSPPPPPPPLRATICAIQFPPYAAFSTGRSSSAQILYAAAFG
jgi:hypothetical protein